MFLKTEVSKMRPTLAAVIFGLNFLQGFFTVVSSMNTTTAPNATSKKDIFSLFYDTLCLNKPVVHMWSLSVAVCILCCEEYIVAIARDNTIMVGRWQKQLLLCSVLHETQSLFYCVKLVHANLAFCGNTWTLNIFIWWRANFALIKDYLIGSINFSQTKIFAFGRLINSRLEGVVNKRTKY